MILIRVSIEQIAGTHGYVHVPVSVDHPAIAAHEACSQGRMPLNAAVFPILPIVIQSQLWSEEEILKQLALEPEPVIKLQARTIHLLDPAVPHRHKASYADALVVIHSQINTHIGALCCPQQSPDQYPYPFCSCHSRLLIKSLSAAKFGCSISNQ